MHACLYMCTRVGKMHKVVTRFYSLWDLSVHPRVTFKHVYIIVVCGSRGSLLMKLLMQKESHNELQNYGVTGRNPVQSMVGKGDGSCLSRKLRRKENHHQSLFYMSTFIKNYRAGNTGIQQRMMSNCNSQPKKN